MSDPEKEAEELLPCTRTESDRVYCLRRIILCESCARRPAVAAELRKRDQEISAFAEVARTEAVQIDALESQLAAAKLKERDDLHFRLLDKLEGWQEEIESLKAQLAAAKVERNMWAKRCNDVLFQRDTANAERDEWKNARQLELEQHVKAAKECNQLRAEIDRLQDRAADWQNDLLRKFDARAAESTDLFTWITSKLHEVAKLKAQLKEGENA